MQNGQRGSASQTLTDMDRAVRKEWSWASRLTSACGSYAAAAYAAVRPYWRFPGVSFASGATVALAAIALMRGPEPPQFRIAIDYLRPYEGSQGGLEILMLASLHNNGTPSVADAWSLAMKSTTVDAHGVPQYIFKTIDFVDARTNKVVLTLDDDDAIFAKALQEPIGLGGFVRGYLRFKFATVSSRVTAQEPVTYVLSARDSLGHWHESEPLTMLAGNRWSMAARSPSD